MTLSHPLSDELAELIARRFHLLAEPTRIKLLDRLRVGEASVHELAAQVGTTSRSISARSPTRACSNAAAGGTSPTTASSTTASGSSATSSATAPSAASRSCTPFSACAL
jgi:DNA-binding transcriptional ArsR family regulator